jgi:hypothetical protein
MCWRTMRAMGKVLIDLQTGRVVDPVEREKWWHSVRQTLPHVQEALREEREQLERVRAELRQLTGSDGR